MSCALNISDFQSPDGLQSDLCCLRWAYFRTLLTRNLHVLLRCYCVREVLATVLTSCVCVKFSFCRAVQRCVSQGESDVQMVQPIETRAVIGR